jgi:peptidoglycan/xylan/chitin deacetylase (PgdA/CDA1 family)
LNQETGNSADIMPIKRFAVFTSKPNFSVLQGIRLLLDELADSECLVMIHAPARPASKLIKNQFRNLKRHGPAWIPYQSAEIIDLIADRLRSSPMRSDNGVGERYRREALKATGRVRFESYTSINGEQAQQALADFDADLGVSLAAPILREGLFAKPRLGTINLHKGKVPEYRGMPPAFWELQAGEKSVGCTIHKMEATLDTGAILLEDELPVSEFSTANGMRVGLDQMGNRLLVQAARALSDSSAVFTPQRTTGANTNTRPPLRVEWRASREAAKKENTVSARQTVKDTIFRGYSTLQSTRRRLSRDAEPNVTVLLYHRVCDDFRDNVTIGIEKFDDHIGFLNKHWNVVSLRDLVNGNVEHEPGRPAICITFDDGYKDNYDYAAPILLNHGVHATFFVSTEKITDGKFFQHDLDKLGHGLPNMSWDNIREMQRDGLDFGSHTVSHANLGKISLDEAERELTESKATIEQELGHEQVLFAYPFGAPTDINEAARDKVAEVGYACCCSAYGGINRGELNLMNILRVPANFNMSLPALRARIDGWGAASQMSY